MSQVEFSITKGIAVITINRPEARNALNAAVFNGLADAFERVNKDADIRVVILTGAGGNFCSGMDLKAFLKGEKMDASGVPFGGRQHIVVDKPVIAAVEGYALAGGFELALACDLIVAATNAQFGLPEVSRGLVATGGGVVKLPRQAPLRIAMEMVMTGDKYDAVKLAAFGLINRTTEPGRALDGAMKMASRIAENAPLAVMISKKVLTKSLSWDLAEAFELQRPFTDVARNSEDAIEGATAFAEKRLPSWSGK